MSRRYILVAVVVVAIIAIGASVFSRDKPVTPLSSPPVAPQPETPEPTDTPAEEAAPVIEPQSSAVADAVESTDNDACQASFDDQARRKPSEYRRAAQEATDLLEVSGNPEFELAAAMVNRRRDPENALELIRRSGGESSRNPMALWVLIDICEDGRAGDCDFAAIERNVRTQHSTNGSLWLAIAGRMAGDGRDQDAARAVRQAIAAPTYNSFLVDQITTMERALAASTDWAYAERVFYSLEYAFEFPPGMRNIFTKCETELSGTWGMLCDELAGRLLENDNDMLTHGMAIELKTKMLEAQGEQVELTDFDSDMIEIAEAFEDEGRILEMLNVLMSDEILLRTLVENMQTGGEIAAFNKLTDDIERLKTTDGYDQCNFVANPYVNPDDF